jgi:uncharacterized damage-inducible protein DinB
MVEAWLRGPVEGVPPALVPVAHALLQVREDIERAAAGLSFEELWAKPGGAASVGFHLRHLAGSTDRLMTYARAEPLSATQRAALVAEQTAGGRADDAASLIARALTVIDAALAQLRSTDPGTLEAAREIGRARLPSTVLGVLFHAGEHAARHAGQAITTAKIVRGLRDG